MDTRLEWIIAHKKAIAIGVGLAGVIIILLALLFRVDGLNITRLNIRSDNLSVSTDGSTLRVFNGAFFYKRSLTKDSDAVVLGGGAKLPEVTRALWANDKGVILNFDQSFINTAVETIANKENLSYTEKAQSTWYFDFSDNSLHHIGNYMLYSEAHYFDSKNNTLYYLEADEGLAIHAFNTTTRQDRIVSSSIDLGTINYIDKCYSSEKICVTGKPLDSPTHTEIYSVADDGNAKEEFSVDGELYPVLGTPYGLILKSEDIAPGTGEGVIAEYQKGFFTNIKTGEEIGINKRFTQNSVLYTTYGDDGNRLAMVGDSNENYTTIKRMLWGSPTQTGQLKYDNGDDFNSAIVIDSTPTKNSVLLKTTEEQYGIFAPNGYVKGDFSVHPSDDVTRHVRACTDEIENTRVEYDDETGGVAILIPDDSNFTSNVSKITTCISKEADLLYGHEVSLTSYDPKSGRVTSY